MEKRCTKQRGAKPPTSTMATVSPGIGIKRKTIRKNGIDNPVHGRGSLLFDKRLINIHMFIHAWTDWTEARLANAWFSRSARVAVTEDRYDDNEDKRGAKFLAGIADRARIPLDQSKSDVWRCRSCCYCEITTYFDRNWFAGDFDGIRDLVDSHNCHQHLSSEKKQKKIILDITKVFYIKS